MLHFYVQFQLLTVQGAHLYVCGDAKMMAKDVRNIIQQTCKVRYCIIYFSV